MTLNKVKGKNHGQEKFRMCLVLGSVFLVFEYYFIFGPILK